MKHNKAINHRHFVAG